jgi:PIN domain nuclease of toxin-antitoxin system
LRDRLLLDSHTLLWSAEMPPRVPPATLRAMDEASEVYFSVVSVAELCIKSSIGKLAFPTSLEANPAAGFLRLGQELGLQLLPLDLEAAAALKSLPLHHKDPFDRLLIAQALTNNLSLVTHDAAMGAYDGLDIIWI